MQWRMQREQWKAQRRVLRDQARVTRDQWRLQRRAYRRPSMLGPLVLVSIGVIALMVQLGKLQASRVFTWYAHWWPLLLVGAGLVLLLEWTIDHTLHPDIPMRRNFGGGVVFLLIVLTVVGVTSTGVNSSNWRDFENTFQFNDDDFSHLFGDKHESDQDVSQAFPTNGVVNIQNPHGDVTVTGTSDDGQIHISIHKQVYSRSDSDASEKADRLSPHITSDGSSIYVNMPGMDGAQSDLRVTVPHAATVTIMANHGDVQASELSGDVNITDNHGDVKTDGIVGSVTTRLNNSGSSFSAHSITGQVTLQGHLENVTVSDINGGLAMSGDFYGDTHVEHIRGPVSFHSSRTNFELARLDGEMTMNDDNLNTDQALGPVTLTTKNRQISLKRVSGSVNVVNTNGEVEVTSAPPLGDVQIQNHDGEVHLTVPEHAGFAVTAQTTDGDISTDFSLHTQTSGNNSTAMGTVNGGGPRIVLNSRHGDIQLRGGEIEPLPPLPPVAKITMTPPAPPSISVMGQDGTSVTIDGHNVKITHARAQPKAKKQ